MRCDICRFDSDGYTWGDLMGSLRAQQRRWTSTFEGVDPVILSRRPDDDTWSALEYASHTAKVLALADELISRALTEHEPDLSPEVALGADDDADQSSVLQHIAHHALSLHEKLALLAPTDRDRRFTFLGSPMTVSDGVEFVVHEANHHVSDAGRVLARVGAGAPAQTGVIVGLFASDGGVPKAEIEQAVVGYRGVQGDRQGTRAHHGRVWQALCLWSGEVIDQLAAEGHPVAPGTAGENVTIRGVDWSTLRPGTRIQLGSDDHSVIIELTAWAVPCHQIRDSFADADEHHIDHFDHPFTSRAYAAVLSDGVLRCGDAVIVEP